MFLKNQSKENIEEYYNLLKIVGGLSNLFSDSNVPYLYYRAAENMFCNAFDAKNLSRSDLSADASKNSVGIGLKTFLNGNGKSLQKIAEFNKDRNEYSILLAEPLAFVEHIASLRNRRIEQTKEVHSIDRLCYHCVSREKGFFLIFEEEMKEIQIENINSIKVKQNSVSFNDKQNEYNFNVSKSTLFKRFQTQNPTKIKVEILKKPYDILADIFEKYKYSVVGDKPTLEFVILPLFSTRNDNVAEKSGLNQWNADGRKRDSNEVYIPVPAFVHNRFPDFFPPNEKGVTFNLHLPNGKILSSSMCQDSFLKINNQRINKGKGLMSNPNRDLGEWILRDILKIKEGVLVTKEMLIDAGMDSVEIRKRDLNNYEIDFKQVNAYYDFVDELEE